MLSDTQQLKNMKNACVNANASVRDAMECLERSALKIALVIDDSLRLLGTLTDGDIRRALLGEADLGSSVDRYMQSRFITVAPSANRAEVLDLMRARQIEQVPVVDERGRLVGLHLLREIIGCVERTNWAVIMAGGRGERLRPMTDSVPKPMLRVAGKPILERLVLHLVGHGIRKVFLSVNYRADLIEKHFRDGSEFGCEIEYLRECKPLGTGGALSLLPDVPNDPLIVLNGDLVTQANVGAMLQFHHDHCSAITVGVREYAHVVPYGCVEVEDQHITRLEEKPVVNRLVNAGIYVLAPNQVRKVPRDRMFPLTALIEACLDSGGRVNAFSVTEDWIDVGQREQLKSAQTGTDSGVQVIPLGQTS